MYLLFAHCINDQKKKLFEINKKTSSNANQYAGMSSLHIHFVGILKDCLLDYLLYFTLSWLNGLSGWQSVSHEANGNRSIPPPHLYQHQHHLNYTTNKSQQP